MPTLPLTKGTKTDGYRYRDALPLNGVLVPKQENPGITTIPGLSKFCNSSGVDRGGIYFESDQLKGHFRVSGQKLVEVIQGLAGPEASELGDIPGEDQVTIWYTLSNLCVVANGSLYLYNRKDGFRQPESSELAKLGEPIDATWINAKNYFLSYDQATKNTYIVQGSVNDDATFDAEKYATSDISPDVPYGIGYITGNSIAVFNRHTIEFFYDAGGTGFTLKRQESRTIYGGIVGTQCKCEFMGTWAYIGGGAKESISVFVINGATASNLATQEIQMILADYTEIELRDARMEARSDRAHNFLILHLPRHTLQYDSSTKQWIQLASGLAYEPYRAINGVYDPRFGGEWLYGDRFLPTLARLDYDTFEQYGEQQHMVLNTPYIKIPNMGVYDFETDFVSGNAPSGSEQIIFMSATQDGITYLPQGGTPLRIASSKGYRDRFYKGNIGHVPNMVSFRLRYQSYLPLTIGAEVSFNVR